MKTELKIVELLSKDIDKKHTINEISRTLGEYYSHIYRVVNRLSSDGVISKTKYGNSYICLLNMKNEKTKILIQLSEIEKRDRIYTNRGLKLMLDDLVKAFEASDKEVMSVVLFGSYAKGTAHDDSDVDVLVIGDENVEIEKIIKGIYAKYGKEITPILMTPTNFKKQKNKTIMREIIENHYILAGVEYFVNMVFSDEV